MRHAVARRDGQSIRAPRHRRRAGLPTRCWIGRSASPSGLPVTTAVSGRVSWSLRTSATVPGTPFAIASTGEFSGTPRSGSARPSCLVNPVDTHGESMAPEGKNSSTADADIRSTRTTETTATRATASHEISLFVGLVPWPACMRKRRRRRRFSLESESAPNGWVGGHRSSPLCRENRAGVTSRCKGGPSHYLNWQTRCESPGLATLPKEGRGTFSRVASGFPPGCDSIGVSSALVLGAKRRWAPLNLRRRSERR